MDNSVISGTPEFTKHFDAIGDLKIKAEDMEGVGKEAAQISTILAQSPLDSIDQKFESYYAKRGFDQQWYKAYGEKSIRSIADTLGRLKEYTYIYAALSGVTHGSDIWKSVFFGKGKAELSPLREPQNTPRVVQLAATLAFRVYRMILCEFRRGEEENFDRKYIQEWRQRFWKKYEIDLNPKQLTI